MEMAKRHLTVAALAFVAIPLMAAAPQPKQEWVRVGTHVGGSPVEVDKKSIFTSGGLTRAWWRTTFAEPRPDGAAQERQLMAIDCGEGLSAALALVATAPGGEVIRDVREPEGAALRRFGRSRRERRARPSPPPRAIFGRARSPPGRRAGADRKRYRNMQLTPAQRAVIRASGPPPLSTP
jgi:hypothetical protein